MDPLMPSRSKPASLAGLDDWTITDVSFEISSKVTEKGL
jgi:hypothetical protein